MADFETLPPSTIEEFLTLSPVEMETFAALSPIIVLGWTTGGGGGGDTRLFIAELPNGEDINTWDPAPEGSGDYIWFVLDADGDVIDIRKGTA